MAVVTTFRPKAELDADQNIREFIEFNKANCPFKVDWDATVWDITDSLTLRGRLISSRLIWSDWDTRRQRRRFTPLPQAFCNFAKAYICSEFRGRKLQVLSRHQTALRALEKVLSAARKSSIESVDHQVLTAAAQLIAAEQSRASAWGAGQKLQTIAMTLTSLGVDAARHWKSPSQWVSPHRSNRVSANTDQATKSKLPDVRSVVALGEIFASSDAPQDVVTTCFAALAMTAPVRCAEVLTLPVNCLTSATSSAEKADSTGLSWRPAKGAEAKTNFCIGPDQSSVAREAVRRLLELGRAARLAAGWYEKNPSDLYLPPGYEHLRGRPLTLVEMSAIRGRNSVPRACKAPEVFGTTGIVGKVRPEDDRLGSGQDWAGLYSFAEFERHTLSRLSRHFPLADRSSGLKFSEALFCLPQNILRANAITEQFAPQMMTFSMIHHQLGANPGGRTVFSRNRKLNDNGEPFKITSHQFRHLLNTLAQSKHLSQNLIAFWSGRRDARQNEWYNHLPQEAYIEAYTKLDAGAPVLNLDGPLETKAQQSRRHNATNRKSALQTELHAVHVTRYGLCRHDYALAPCPRDKDCINCGEHLFTKGSSAQLMTLL